MSKENENVLVEAKKVLKSVENLISDLTDIEELLEDGIVKLEDSGITDFNFSKKKSNEKSKSKKKKSKTTKKKSWIKEENKKLQGFKSQESFIVVVSSNRKDWSNAVTLEVPNIDCLLISGLAGLNSYFCSYSMNLTHQQIKTDMQGIRHKCQVWNKNRYVKFYKISKNKDLGTQIYCVPTTTDKIKDTEEKEKRLERQHYISNFIEENRKLYKAIKIEVVE